jgi:hypothetical protein
MVWKHGADAANLGKRERAKRALIGANNELQHVLGISKLFKAIFRGFYGWPGEIQ